MNIEMPALTDEQKLLVEQNHKLIYDFIYKKNLNFEEYYDILAIYLCRAAMKFEPEKGFCFSTFVFSVFNNCLKVMWRESTLARTIPESMVFSYDAQALEDGSSYISIIPDDFNLADYVIGKNIYSYLLSLLTDKERYIAHGLMNNKTLQQMADELNCSKQNIGNYVQRIRIKLQRFKK